jgi:hypothetical protein
MTERTYDEPLTMIKGLPVNAAGEIGCVMKVVGRVTEESNWFRYKPGFFAKEVEIEWPRDMMEVVIENDVARYLLDNGYARAMTEAEMNKWNDMLKPTEDKS